MLQRACHANVTNCSVGSHSAGMCLPPQVSAYGCRRAQTKNIGRNSDSCSIVVYSLKIPGPGHGLCVVVIVAAVVIVVVVVAVLLVVVVVVLAEEVVVVVVVLVVVVVVCSLRSNLQW